MRRTLSSTLDGFSTLEAFSGPKAPPITKGKLRWKAPACIKVQVTSLYMPLGGIGAKVWKKACKFSLVGLRRHSAWDGCSTNENEVKPKQAKQDLIM